MAGVRSAVAGKDWRPRAVLIPILAYYLFRHLGDFSYEGIYGGLNLVLHEAGHPLFSWSRNELLTIAGGTLFEMLCPILVGIMFYRQRDMMGMVVALFWLGTTFLDAAPYAADARAQVLPLVSTGDGPIGHDWFEMLYRFELLQYDQQIAGGLRGIGLALLITSLAGAVLVVKLMREEGASPRVAAAPGGNALGLSAEELRLRQHFTPTGETRPDAPKRTSPGADSREEKRKGLGVDAEEERLRRRFEGDLEG